MNILTNQRGSSHLAALLGVAVIVVIGVVGYRVMKTTDTGNIVSSATRSTSKAPDSIKSTADLKQAGSALDSTAIDGSVNPNQLDGELNSL